MLLSTVWQHVAESSDLRWVVQSEFGWRHNRGTPAVIRKGWSGVSPGDVDEFPRLFQRASYLCMAAIKSCRDHQRGFDSSRARVVYQGDCIYAVHLPLLGDA